MDVTSLNKLTVPQLKKELKDRGLPLAGVKADLVARLASFISQQPSSVPRLSTQTSAQYLDPSQMQHLHQIPQHIHDQIHQLQMLPTQTNTYYSPVPLPSLPLPTTLLATNATIKTMELQIGLVDPRDKFGAVVSSLGFGDEDVVEHEGLEWAFYCTKSMDYQIWATVYFKCLKKKMKKRGLSDAIPNIDVLVEFPSGKKIKGVLSTQNGHRLVLIKDANTTMLMKTYGANDKETISNVKVTLRTLTEGESRQADRQETKKPKLEEEKEDMHADWGVYGQMDSDDENRSEYENSSDYSSEDEEDSPPD